MKASLTLSLLALSVSSVFATPPACLLAAVNTEPQPGDLSQVCGSDAKKVQAAIASMCSGSNASIAQSAFAATCSAAGKTVASYTPSATPSASLYSGVYVYTTAVYNSDCSCTTTIVTSATGGSLPSSFSISATATVTGSGPGTSSSATGAAAAGPQNMGSFAAAAIAIAGVVAVL